MNFIRKKKNVCIFESAIFSQKSLGENERKKEGWKRGRGGVRDRRSGGGRKVGKQEQGKEGRKGRRKEWREKGRKG